MARTLDSGEGACSHARQAPHLRTLSNGTKAIYLQCPDCGETKSQAIKKTSLTPGQYENLPAFDETLRESRQNQASAVANEKWQAESRERQARYDAYLASPEWKAKARAAMQRDDYLCQSCLAEGRHGIRAEHVHHLTYKHRYNERLFELVSLCEPCHKDYHEDWI